MARATVVPTAASSTSRATLERTLVRNVTPSSWPSRTSYVRSGTGAVASGGEIVLAGPDDGGGGEADGWTRPPPPRKRRWWLVPLVVLAVVAVGAAFVRLPYDTIAPGNSRQVNDVVLVKGGPSYPPTGQILE